MIISDLQEGIKEYIEFRRGNIESAWGSLGREVDRCRSLQCDSVHNRLVEIDQWKKEISEARAFLQSLENWMVRV